MERNSVVFDTKVSEIELSYKPQQAVSTLPKVDSSEDAYRVFIETWDSEKLEFIEQFRAIFLNRASRVIGICTVTSGGLSSTVLDYRLLYAAALKALASAVIIAHNHPSGNPKPSEADKKVTKLVHEAGKLLDIALIDHLIVTKEGYYSFSEQGAL